MQPISISALTQLSFSNQRFHHSTFLNATKTNKQAGKVIRDTAVAVTKTTRTIKDIEPSILYGFITPRSSEGRELLTPAELRVLGQFFTVQEIEVDGKTIKVLQVAADPTNIGIANRLERSPRTVQAQLSSICTKLNLESRSQMVDMVLIANSSFLAPVDVKVQLTPAEMRVAKALLGGATNKEIGKRLKLSPRTIQTHLSSICSKLGLGNYGLEDASLEDDKGNRLFIIDRFRRGGLFEQAEIDRQNLPAWEGPKIQLTEAEMWIIEHLAGIQSSVPKNIESIVQDILSRCGDLNSRKELLNAYFQGGLTLQAEDEHLLPTKQT